jgi:hypothetical protein
MESLGQLTNFGRFVPTAHQEKHSREKPRFDAAEDESESKKGSIRVRSCHSGTQSTPDEHDSWEKQRWTGSTQYHVGRDFAYEVPDEEDR